MKKIRSSVAVVMAVAVASLVTCPILPAQMSFADQPDVADVQQDAGAEQPDAAGDATQEGASTSDGTSDVEPAAQEPGEPGAAEVVDEGVEKADKAKAEDSSESDEESDSEDTDVVIDDPDAEDDTDVDGESAVQKKDPEKALASAATSSDKAADAASKLAGLKEKLASAQKDYQKITKKIAKLKKKSKKVKKKIKKAKADAKRAQGVVTAVNKELAASPKVGLISVLVGKASFDDIDSRAYLLKKVSQDRKDAVAELDKLQAQQAKIAKKIKKSIAKQQQALSETKLLGNKIAFEIEKQTSAVRAHDDAAESAVKEAEGSDSAVDAAKESVKSSKGAHDSARKDVDASVGDWYALVDATPEADAALSFGEGADFAMEEEDFVAKWGKAVDLFFGSGPLAGQGETIATSAYKHKIDPRLCAAVSIIESSGGVACIRPHNAWGWGAADNDPYNLASEWGSWEEAIEAWHEGMATSTTGLASAKTLDELGAIYCSSADWSANVATEMEKISELAQQVQKNLEKEKAEKKSDESKAKESEGESKAEQEQDKQ